MLEIAYKCTNCDNCVPVGYEEPIELGFNMCGECADIKATLLAQEKITQKFFEAVNKDSYEDCEKAVMKDRIVIEDASDSYKKKRIMAGRRCGKTQMNKVVSVYNKLRYNRNR